MTLGLQSLTILLLSGAVAAPATVVPIAAEARPSGSARKPLVGGRHVSKSENQAGAPERTARQQVVRANEDARMQPVRSGFVNAMQVFAWTEGSLFQVYASPGQITDIMLQPGEKLFGTGPVAAGDTARWIIGDTVSGSPEGERVHILIKPTRPDIATNLLINTDRRTYHVELRATSRTYMASVSWTYPQDGLVVIRGKAAAPGAASQVARDIEPARLFFGYKLSGDRPRWRPVRVFDDGRQAFVEFPQSVGQDVMPPLFILGQGGGAELVNYRVQGRYMIVDRLFDRAELRLGDRRGAQSVQIRRQEARR
ncbi:P-type conjugative transfer protein TrbG [Sphingobium chungangianum]